MSLRRSTVVTLQTLRRRFCFLPLQLNTPKPRFQSTSPAANSMAPHLQDEVYASSIKDPEAFWTHQAEQLHWHKKPSRALQRSTKKLKSGVEHPHWTWFPDGEISTSYNCVDRHVEKGNGDVPAIVWDSPVTGSKETYTYKQLLEEVETLAGVLREEGVKKGDVVLVYSVFSPWLSAVLGTCLTCV